MCNLYVGCCEEAEDDEDLDWVTVVFVLQKTRVKHACYLGLTHLLVLISLAVRWGLFLVG